MAETRPLYQSRVPLTGYLGVQRTPRGSATVMNIGVNIDGQEWLIPQLTPNQDPEDLFALLTGKSLTPEQERRITDRAIEFAMQEERRQPGTFPKYNSILDLEADARGESAGKGMIPALPEPPPALPGRP